MREYPKGSLEMRGGGWSARRAKQGDRRKTEEDERRDGGGGKDKKTRSTLARALTKAHRYDFLQA